MRFHFLGLCAVVWCGASALVADDSLAALKKEMAAIKADQERATRQLTDQEAELNQLRTQLTGIGIAQVQDTGAVIQLQNNASKLQISGDLRLRYDYSKLDDDASKGGDGDHDEQRRVRHRFRIAMKWITTDRWVISAGLATGGSSGTSTNFTWNSKDYWETGDIRLDYAYAEHRWGATTLILGQQPNPIRNAGIIIDSSCRPTGVSLLQTIGPGYVRLGAYDLLHLGTDEAEAALAVAQAGVELGSKDGVQGSVALAYYHFNAPARDETGASEPCDYHLGDLLAEVTIPVGGFEVTWFGEYTYNFGAEGEPGDGQSTGSAVLDPSDNNQAYYLGVDVTFRKLTVGYHYLNVEADAYYNPLKDSAYEVGDAASDVKGHEIEVRYSFSKNLNAKFSCKYLDRDNDEETPNDQVEKYQLDLNYRF